MPYMEIWVDDPAPDDKQMKALGELIAVAREVAGRQWPGDDALALESAAKHAAREFGLDGNEPFFPTDRSYHKWKKERDNAVADSGGR